MKGFHGPPCTTGSRRAKVHMDDDIQKMSNIFAENELSARMGAFPRRLSDNIEKRAR